MASNGVVTWFNSRTSALTNLPHAKDVNSSPNDLGNWPEELLRNLAVFLDAIDVLRLLLTGTISIRYHLHHGLRELALGARYSSGMRSQILVPLTQPMALIQGFTQLNRVALRGVLWADHYMNRNSIFLDFPGSLDHLEVEFGRPAMLYFPVPSVAQMMMTTSIYLRPTMGIQWGKRFPKLQTLRVAFPDSHTFFPANEGAVKSVLESLPDNLTMLSLIHPNVGLESFEALFLKEDKSVLDDPQQNVSSSHTVYYDGSHSPFVSYLRRLTHLELTTSPTDGSTIRKIPNHLQVLMIHNSSHLQPWPVIDSDADIGWKALKMTVPASFLRSPVWSHSSYSRLQNLSISIAGNITGTDIIAWIDSWKPERLNSLEIRSGQILDTLPTQPSLLLKGSLKSLTRLDIRDLPVWLLNHLYSHSLPEQQASPLQAPSGPSHYDCLTHLHISSMISTSSFTETLPAQLQTLEVSSFELPPQGNPFSLLPRTLTHLCIQRITTKNLKASIVHLHGLPTGLCKLVLKTSNHSMPIEDIIHLPPSLNSLYLNRVVIGKNFQRAPSLLSSVSISTATEDRSQPVASSSASSTSFPASSPSNENKASQSAWKSLVSWVSGFGKDKKHDQNQPASASRSQQQMIQTAMAIFPLDCCCEVVFDFE